MKVEGTVALIGGGASGLGRATAELLARSSGAGTFVMLDRPDEVAEHISAFVAAQASESVPIA